MAETDPVSVVVEVLESVSDELKEIRAEIEKLDATSVGIDFDIEDGGEIQSTRAQIQSLRDNIESDLDIDTDGFTSAQAKKQALSTDMHSTLHIDDEAMSATPIGPDEPWLGSVREESGFNIDRMLRNEGGLAPGQRSNVMDSLSDRDILPSQIPNIGSATDSYDWNFRHVGLPDGDVVNTIGENTADARRNVGQLTRKVNGVIDPANELRRTFSDIGDVDFGSRPLTKQLNNLRPNIMDVWNALATVIPVMFTVGAAAIGLAAALGAVAAAGVAVVGVGLLGYGDSLSESFQKAQQQVSNLGQELHEVMQPAAQQFRPILDQWMSGAPGQIQQLVDPISDLIVYTDTLEAAGSGIIDWVGEVISTMVRLEGIVSQVVLRFGELAGQFLIDFLESMTIYLYENQDAIIQLVSTIGQIIGALFNLFHTVSMALARLSPFFDILASVANLLNNQLTVHFLTFIGVLLMLENALAAAAAITTAVNIGLANMAAGIIGNYLPALSMAIASTWEWIAALTTLQKVLLASGIGLALYAVSSVLGGVGGPGGSGHKYNPDSSSGGGSGGDTYINVQGDVGDRELDRLIDHVPGETRNEMSMQNEMNTP